MHTLWISFALQQSQNKIFEELRLALGNAAYTQNNTVHKKAKEIAEERSIHKHLIQKNPGLFAFAPMPCG